jgi:hypothetical protein
VPDEFSNSGLEFLDLSENPLVSLPPIPFVLGVLKLNFTGISDLSGIVPARNNVRILHAVGNGISQLPLLPSLEELIVSGNNLTASPQFDCVGFMTPTIDLSFNKITKLPESTATFRLFDVSGNAIVSIPDRYFGTTSRLCFTDNPIEQSLASELNVVESLDIVGTQIEIGEPGKRVQEVLKNWTGEESTGIQTLYLNCDENVGYSEMIGMRPAMEDAIVIRQHFREGMGFFAIFDGHCGRMTARYAAAGFPSIFKEGEVSEERISQAFDRFHEQMISLNEMSGSTADLLFLEDKKATIAHLGDGKIAVFDVERNPTF